MQNSTVSAAPDVMQQNKECPKHWFLAQTSVSVQLLLNVHTATSQMNF